LTGDSKNITGLLLMDCNSSAAVSHSEDGFTVDAEIIAAKLGLSTDLFWREVKRGIVYGVVERGEGDDAGRVRLTFRYRARSWSTTLEDTVQ
jgi:Family of unknown function (DUF6522)